MSASREKKLRQDLAAQGITDPKLIREAEEKAKARKTNTLYGIIAAVFVVVAAAVLVYNSGVLQRGKTAVTIDGEKYTAAQVNYYYMSRKNSILQRLRHLLRPGQLQVHGLPDRQRHRQDAPADHRRERDDVGRVPAQ